MDSDWSGQSESKFSSHKEEEAFKEVKLREKKEPKFYTAKT